MQSTEGILSAIGKTPLISLKKLFDDLTFNLYVKLENMNPGGSIKDRPACNMIENALREGHIGENTVVIESSSGNLGIGLAQVCAFHRLRFICVVDSKTTKQNIRMLEAYGAELEIVEEPDAETGEFLNARLKRVRTLIEAFPNSFWTNQYANSYNALVHYETMREIVEALNGQVDYLFCATSTCGTLRGCAEYVKKHGMSTKIYAVDAVGSAIFERPEQFIKRLIPGHGASRRPELFRDDLADAWVAVTDEDCVAGCLRLLRKEALLAGGSTGGQVRAIEKMRDQLHPMTNCVFIACDRGERYLDTIYSEAWVGHHFGDVLPL